MKDIFFIPYNNSVARIVPALKANNILDLIGGTPLVPINRIKQDSNVEILAKLEYYNPAGSVKERPALYMIEEAEKKGELTKDKISLKRPAETPA